MARWLTIVLLVGVAGGGGVLLWQQHRDREARREIEAALAAARHDFAELARAAAEEEGEPDYRRRVLKILQDYERTLSEQVYAARPEWRDVEAYRRRLQTQFDERRLSSARRENQLEGFEIVREAYETLKSGQWKSILTQAGAGDTRLDLYALRRTHDDQGDPILEFRFFFWGLDEAARASWGQLSLRYWHTVEETVRRGRRRVVEPVEKVLGRVEGEARPHIFINNPQDFIAEFPPYVAVGYFWLPVMPREATSVDITLRYVVARAGSRYDSELRWTRLPIPAGWKLAEGETWDANVVPATDDELAGIDDTAETPAPGANGSLERP